MTDALSYPFGAMRPETPAEIAPGVVLLPIPVPFPPGTVNAVALAEDDGWTIVDTGLCGEATEAVWRRFMAGPLGGRPIRRVVATHHHPDHLGLVGWFQRVHGAELWTTRTAWLFARMLQLDAWETPPAEATAFMRRCGYDQPMMARYQKRAAQNFSVTVAPMPLGFRALSEGETVTLGGRDWLVLFGHGHAPDHAVLWDRAGGLVIGGDQILPKITPNIGVYPTEPAADPLGDWLASCRRFARLLDDDVLVLPGHGDPFRGARRRLSVVMDKHRRTLDRLAAHLETPRRVVDCFAALYRREITAPLEGLATVEAVAHLNRLLAEGRAACEMGADGAALWRQS